MGQGSSQVAEPLESLQHEENASSEDNERGNENTPIIRSPRELSKTSKPKESQQGTPAQPKRKRKSSESSRPATASSERPSDVKRKRLVDFLENHDHLVSNRNPKSKPPSSRKNSVKPTVESPAHVARTKRVANLVPRAGDKISPSPALTTGDRMAKGRLNMADGSSNHRGTVGAFNPAEVEALEAFKIEFCNSNGCTAMTFDLMVQHGRVGAFPTPNGVNKLKFWKEARDVLPNRDKRSIYRFMKRHFLVPGQKPHEWTEEQDDELVVLYHQHGPKWVHIAEQLGRGSDDVVQRWKNHLEHRDTMKVGVWTEAELDALKKTMRSVWEKLGAEGYDVGRHPFELDESLISWGQVSAGLQHSRSRQQCADKWRRMKQNAFADSRSNSRSNHASKSRSTTPAVAGQAKKPSPRARNSLSDKYIFSDANESDEASETKKSLQENNSSSSSEGSDDSDSARESDSDSEGKSERDNDDQPASSNKTKTMVVKKESTPNSDADSDSDSTGNNDSDKDSESGSESEDETASKSKSKAMVIKKESTLESDTNSGSDSSRNKGSDSDDDDGGSGSEDEAASKSKKKKVVGKNESIVSPRASSNSDASSDAETDSSDSGSETDAKINSATVQRPKFDSKIPSRRSSSSPSSAENLIKKEDSESEDDSRNILGNKPNSAGDTAIITTRDETSDDSSSEESSSSGSDSDSDSDSD
ncbi:hypothetical protein BJX70DRAFT_354165 [Aspergillus crustosus]